MAVWTPKARWGFAQGITHTFSRVGNAATALIVSALIGWLSWRWSFHMLAPVDIAWAALWFWYFRDDPRAHLSATPRYSRDCRSARRGRGLACRGLTRAMDRTRDHVDFCYGWTLWIFQNWIQSYFVQNYRLDLQTACLLFRGCAVRRRHRRHGWRRVDGRHSAPHRQCCAGTTGGLASGVRRRRGVFCFRSSSFRYSHRRAVPGGCVLLL